MTGRHLPPRKGAMSAYQCRVEEASQFEPTDSRQQINIDAESKMMKRRLAVSALAGALSLHAGLTLAQDDKRAQDRLQTQSQDQIYGSELMTQQERTEYQSRMRSANTDEERERVRQEHHERMKDRAKDRGVTLPDQPPADRGGMGSGSGMSPGGGMGPGGGGMGSGGGRSR